MRKDIFSIGIFVIILLLAGIGFAWSASQSMLAVVILGGGNVPYPWGDFQTSSEINARSELAKVGYSVTTPGNKERYTVYIYPYYTSQSSGNNSFGIGGVYYQSNPTKEEIKFDYYVWDNVKNMTKYPRPNSNDEHTYTVKFKGGSSRIDVNSGNVNISTGDNGTIGNIPFQEVMAHISQEIRKGVPTTTDLEVATSEQQGIFVQGKYVVGVGQQNSYKGQFDNFYPFSDEMVEYSQVRSINYFDHADPKNLSNLKTLAVGQVRYCINSKKTVIAKTRITWLGKNNHGRLPGEVLVIESTAKFLADQISADTFIEK